MRARHHIALITWVNNDIQNYSEANKDVPSRNSIGECWWFGTIVRQKGQTQFIDNGSFIARTTSLAFEGSPLCWHQYKNFVRFNPYKFMAKIWRQQTNWSNLIKKCLEMRLQTILKLNYAFCFSFYCRLNVGRKELFQKSPDTMQNLTITADLVPGRVRLSLELHKSLLQRRKKSCSFKTMALQLQSDLWWLPFSLYAMFFFGYQHAIRFHEIKPNFSSVGCLTSWLNSIRIQSELCRFRNFTSLFSCIPSCCPRPFQWMR